MHSEQKCVRRNEKRGKVSQTQILDQYFQLRSNKTYSLPLSHSASLSSVGVSTEGSCGRRLSAGHQYASRLCLLWCGQQNNFNLILQINSCTPWKAASTTWPAGDIQRRTAHVVVVLLLLFLLLLLLCNCSFKACLCTQTYCSYLTV